MSRSLKPGFYLSCRKCLTSCRTLENTVSPHGTALISANGQIAIIPPVMRVTNPNGSQVAGESREIVLFFFLKKGKYKRTAVCLLCLQGDFANSTLIQKKKNLTGIVILTVYIFRKPTQVCIVTSKEVLQFQTFHFHFLYINHEQNVRPRKA